MTTSVQIDPPAAAAAGTVLGYVRTAISTGGTAFDDGEYGHYIVSNGTAGQQDSHTRSSIVPVSAGQLVSFGAHIYIQAASASGSQARVRTTYICS